MAAAWPFSTVRKSLPSRRNLLALCLTVPLTLLVGKLPGRGGVLRQPPAPPEAGCRRVYRLGAVSYRQEEEWPAVGGCVAPLLTPALLRRCVEQRARRRRRPTSLLVLGDSRMRLLYQRLAEELGAPTPPETTKPDGSWQRHIHWTNSPERWCQLCPWNCCPRAAAAAGVALRFEWRPFWTEAMVTELEAAAESCARGHRDCPDLVLVNGALWYWAIFKQFLQPRLEMAELMRQQVSRAAPALARLASLTRLVWKLDEETINDIVGDVHRSGPAEVPTLHAVVYDAARKIPGLVIWSSALPESTGFTRIKCQPLKKFVRSGVLNEATFHHECGQDVAHGSVAVMTKAVQMMFTDLCARDLDFTTLGEETQNMSVMPPFCCSTQMDT